MIIHKRRGNAIRCSPIPSLGSRIALYRDKQLELAHVVIYDTPYSHIYIINVNWAQYTPRGRSGCASSCTIELRDSTTEDNVRKRPFQ